MIFKQYLLVLSEKKWQTRRLVNPNDGAITEGSFVRAAMVILAVIDVITQRRRFYVGQRLPIIPKRGQPAIRDAAGNIRRVEIVSIRRELLQNITEEDARAEGVASVAEYRALWDSINDRKGTRWDDNPLVWVISFKLVAILTSVGR